MLGRRKTPRRKKHPVPLPQAMGQGRTKDDTRRNKRHRDWIKGLPCLIRNAECSGDVVPAHVRRGTDGGTSLKPSDKWVVPCCFFHHAVFQHNRGEETFEATYGIDMKAEAARYWKLSPYGKSE